MLKKIIFSLPLLALFFLPLLAKAQDKNSTDKKKETTISDNWFVWKLSGNPIGYLHFVEKKSNRKDADILVKQHIAIEVRQQKVEMITKMHCRNDQFYTPVYIEGKVRSRGFEMNYTVEVEWKKNDEGKEVGHLVAKAGKKRKRELEITPRTVVDFNVFRLLKKVPFDEKKTLVFDFLETKNMAVKKDHKLKYTGSEEMEMKGKKFKVHKFTHEGPRTRPSHYWINEKREIVKIVIDERRVIVRSTEMEARKAYVTDDKR